MTRLPLENRSVQGVLGDAYELNQRCAVPGCTEGGNERHHLWRRSFLVGDYWWVSLPNGTVVGNCVGLCMKHHMAITTNNAEIRYLDDAFMWVPPTGDISRLAWQPPAFVDPGETVYEGHPQAQVEGEERMLNKAEFDQLHDHDHDGECPTCHQRIKPPKIQSPPEEKKNRRTFSIAVPKDRQENGAEVLDVLIVEAGKVLDEAGIHYGDEHTYKYHKLATSLALFVAHGKEILANG